MERWIADARKRRARGELSSDADVVPAGTVAVIRDSEGGLEVLLARRSSKLAFHGGSWVFPGGRVDPGDFGDDPHDLDRAAAMAAARETLEEVGLHVDVHSLVYMSHWTTPEISPKRFATWFFLTSAQGGDEVVDGSETTAFRWFKPAEALAERDAGEIELAPPQYVTLLDLCEFETVEDALREIGSRDSLEVLPRIVFFDDGATACVYDDDVTYADEVVDFERPGRRHRLVMRADNRWSYERD